MSVVVREITSHRIFFDEPVLLYLHDQEKPILGRALNLSCGGVYVCAEELLPEDSMVQVHFALPGEEPMLAPARVLRTISSPPEQFEPVGMALRFENLQHQHAETIERFILSRLQPAAGEPVHLELGGVHVPIKARTHSTRGNIISFDAELPFLRIGTSVSLHMPESTAYSNSGHLRWVSIHLPPGTEIPRINLGVELHEQTVQWNLDEEQDPVCTYEFVDHTQTLDQRMRTERRIQAKCH